jgi:hypothetical protein
MKHRILIALCLTPAFIAGCSSTEDYVDDVNEIQEQVIKASNSIGSDVNASKKEIVNELEGAKAEAEEAVAELEDVDVPSDAEEGHEQLIKGFEHLEKLYADVQKQVESGSGAAFEELRSEGTRIDKEIDSALDQINKQLGLE